MSGLKAGCRRSGTFCPFIRSQKGIGAAGSQVTQPRYTFLLFLVSLNILLAIIVESFLRVKQAGSESLLVLLCLFGYCSC